MTDRTRASSVVVVDNNHAEAALDAGWITGGNADLNVHALTAGIPQGSRIRDGDNHGHRLGMDVPGLVNPDAVIQLN
jgi:hypothetical protein